ncbi:MAG: hypothetical protein DRI90_18685 [Deltaproteobacteria bacterium]|nr:MAG: hypothetical protein DRI90_18685 [Deltaproteobacteria bacterium]
MDCGQGRWGDIPVQPGTLYVDAAYSGSGDGSASQPFTTIGAAVDAATDGALIAVAAGTYAEDVMLHKPVRLWGVCPQHVVLVGAGANLGALEIRPGGSGAEVRGLAITGDNDAAVAISGAKDVALAQLWVHDAAGHGLHVEDALGPTSVTVERSLIEDNHDFGVFVAGSEATLAGLVVRDTHPQQSNQQGGRGISIQSGAATGAPARVVATGSVVERNHTVGVLVIGSEATLAGLVIRDTQPQQSDQQFGRGVHIQPASASGAAASVSITGSVVEHSHEVGVFVMSSEATFAGLVVRDTLPRQSDQQFGRGITIQRDFATGTPASATITGSLVEQSHEIGVVVSGSEATLAGLVVRDTQPQQSDQESGRGIHIEPDPDTGGPASAIVTGSLVERSHDVGVLVAGSEATLAGLLVRDTRPQQSNQQGGRGISVQFDPATTAPATVAATGSLVEHSHEIGVVVMGSEATLTGLVVRDTQPQQSDQRSGRGIHIQHDLDTGTPAGATVTASLVEHNYDFGIAVAGAQLTLVGSLVRGTLPQISDGLFGDGVVVVSVLEPASAVVTDSRVTESARAGLASFGAAVTLGGSALGCNTIDLNGEVFLGQPFVFEDLGGNGCGCPDATGPCKAISAGLAPPVPLDDTQ